MKALRVILAVIGGLLLTGAAAAADSQNAEASGRTVFILPVRGTIDQSMLYIFRRAFRDIERTKPSAVILELDTPGGRLAETREILQWLRSLRPDIPVYSFVNPDAYSAEIGKSTRLNSSHRL